MLDFPLRLETTAFRSKHSHNEPLAGPIYLLRVASGSGVGHSLSPIAGEAFEQRSHRSRLLRTLIAFGVESINAPSTGTTATLARPQPFVCPAREPVARK